MLADVVGNPLERERRSVDVLVVLRRNHHGVDGAGGLTVVSDGHLGFAVRTQIGDDALFSHEFEAFRQAVSIENRCRHEIHRLGAGITKHDSLVARTKFLALDDRLVDFFCLVADRHHDSAGIAVKTRRRRVVSDADDHFPHELVDIDIAFGLDFASNVDKPPGSEAFDRNLGVPVLSEYRVQNRIGQLVAQFVRVSARHRFAGKKS